MKKYMKKSEIVSYSIGLFGLALLTGWMPDYTYTFFNDFAFKGSGIDGEIISKALVSVFFVAGIIGGALEIIVGLLVDRTKSKKGKILPWIGYGCVPVAVIAVLVFIAPSTSNATVAIGWMFVIYSLYTMASVAVESPANCFGSVCTPNAEERGDAISIASICRSIGQSGGQVVILVVGIVMKLILGEDGFKAAEGKGLDLTISTVICALGCVLFLGIMYRYNQERVPYTTEKVSIKDSIKVVFTNKNLLMVALTKLAGFGRGVYGTVSLYIAVYLLGDKGLKLALLLPMGIGTAVGMLVVKKLLKVVKDTRNVYLICCLYGATTLTVLFIVTKIIGFNSSLVIPFLIINFFVGLQHGNTNLTPNVMIADCVDEIEWKTGKRQEGLCYAGYGLFSKIASAFTKSLGPALIVWAGYIQSTDPNVAYAAQSDATLNKFLMIYTIIPAVFVILQGVPLLFYDLTGKKKAQISADLIARRGVLNDGMNEEIDETVEA